MIDALKRSWDKVPPLFEVVAAFAGVKPTQKLQVISSPDEARMLLAATGGRVEGIGQM